MQAYPDEIGKMDFAHRRDAYCGKFAVTDVFTQYQVPFTVMKPHVVYPIETEFFGCGGVCVKFRTFRTN